jgi:hypothetical protein
MLTSILDLWAKKPKLVTQLKEAILGFFRKTLPDKWREFTDTVTDYFQIISLDKYNVI